MASRLPPWLKQPLPDARVLGRMRGLLRGFNLHTVCESAECPNAGECFSFGTAAFLILGDTCTRRCTFCAVNKKGAPLPVDMTEPVRVNEAARKLGLRYVVVTSVTRDDLPDGGAALFAATTGLLREDDIAVELLVPDFGGSSLAAAKVAAAQPQVFGHNVETVPRLYPRVRPGASFERSLELLQIVKRLHPGIVTKAGLMVGLGETEKEIREVMERLRGVGCDIITIGQYLRPSPGHYPVARFITPGEFAGYQRTAQSIGFRGVASSPLVRSSFRAAELYEEVVGIPVRNTR